MQDPIFDLIEKERERQTHGIELIASENFVSENVMKAMGSVLTTNMQKAILADVITAVAKWWIK